MMTDTTFQANISIGHLVWWQMEDSKIAPDALRAILADEGLDPSAVPDIDEPAAVRRAARQWTQGRGNATRYRSEVVYDDGRRIEVGVLRREQVDAHEVKWVQVDVVAYDVDSNGGVLRDRYVGNGTGEADAVAEDVDGAVRFLDHEWIRPNLVQNRLGAMGALNVRRAGAVAFVASRYEAQLRQLQRVVRRIGASEFEAAKIAPDDAATRETVLRHAGQNLTEAVTALLGRVAEWESSSRSVPAHAAASILAEYADISERGELYSAALGAAIEGLREKLDDAATRARGILSGAHLAADQEVA